MATPTPNCKIMFDSTVSYLKSIVTTYNKVRMALLEMQMIYVNSDGYLLFADCNTRAYKDLTNRAEELFAELIRVSEEAGRLRGLLNESSDS